MLLMGLIVSWLMVAFGLLRVAIALSIEFGADNAESLAYFSARYLGTKTPWPAVDQGIVIFICGVALGVLVTIGRELQLQNRK